MENCAKKVIIHNSEVLGNKSVEEQCLYLEKQTGKRRECKENVFLGGVGDSRELSQVDMVGSTETKRCVSSHAMKT